MPNRKKLLKQGLWYFFFTTIILLIIATRYFKYFTDLDSFLPLFYLIITTLSHFISLSFLIFLLYLPVILIFPYRTLAWIYSALLSTLGALLLLLDTYVFNLYRMHINRFALELIFGGAGSQIFEFHIKQYFLTGGIFILFLALMLFGSYRFYIWDKVLSFKRGWVIVIVTVFMMLGTHSIHMWAEAANYIPITKSSRYYPLFYPTVDRNLMFKLGIVDESKMKDNIWLSANTDSKDLNYPQHSIVSDTICKTNIILILIDSWYYKSFDSVAMPNLYNFSKQCSVYNKHYSGSNGTRTGVFSLFYGIPGTYWDMVLSTLTGPVLVDELLKNKYTIKTFTSASLISPPFDRTVFRKIKNLKVQTLGNSVYNRDIQLTEDWISYVTSQKENTSQQPVFSFLFYDVLHSMIHPADYKGPFKPEWQYPKYELLNNNMDPTPFLNLYKNSAHFVDSLVGKVLTNLEENGLLENSWIIITGDHGQEFNDNKKNFWGHNGNYSAAQMQVPMLIYKPNEPHAVYDHWTSHYDFVPTLLTELFHCKNPIADYSIGKHIDDTSGRDWLLIGSSDNYAIIQPNRINSVYFDGSFDITDQNLNPINGAKLQTNLIKQIMFSSSCYYKK